MKNDPPERVGSISGMAVTALFLIAVVVVPILVGDLYPFSHMPMFEAGGERFTAYRALDASGRNLDLLPLRLHQVYDGNPPLSGHALLRVESFNRWGFVPSPGELKKHVEKVAPGIPDDNLPLVIEMAAVGSTGRGAGTTGRLIATLKLSSESGRIVEVISTPSPFTWEEIICPPLFLDGQCAHRPSVQELTSSPRQGE